MFGIGGQELILLMLIGLIVLGPERLPRIANQIGNWLGQARRMTRVMKRQLEEELDIGDDLKDLKNIGDELRDDLTIRPGAMHVPRDDDTYSPLHDDPEPAPVSVDVPAAEADDTDDAVEADDEKEELPTGTEAQGKQA